MRQRLLPEHRRQRVLSNQQLVGSSRVLESNPAVVPFLELEGRFKQVAILFRGIL
jgi:hypothetical protein